MKAIVMAGGEGTRLRPLTCNIPKPLVNVANKPVMEYVIKLLKEHGIDEIIVTLHYLADEILSYFGDGSDFGVRINYSIEDEPLGTAGSVKKAEKLLNNETFIVLSADALTDINLTDAIEFHKKSNSLVTVTLTSVENPLEYGVVIMDEKGHITRLMEKPSWGEVFSDNINTGIYIIEPQVLGYLQENKNYDFSKDLFPMLIEKKEPILGFITDGYWCDIGNLQQYRQANNDILSRKVNMNIDAQEIRKGVWVQEGSYVSSQAKINSPCLIGKNCRINPNVVIDEFSVIGDNCILEESVYINRCVLLQNVYVGKKSRLTGAIISRQTIIKSQATVSEGVVIGDKCYLGEGATINPQVKIWPEKNVEPSASVSMSLVWGMKWPGSLFSIEGIKGLGNIELTPEFALKLGASYGAYLEKGSVVVTSRGAHVASRMLNRAIICGLISVGVDVQDFRIIPSPITRFAIRTTNTKGGVHVKVSPHDPENFLIQFFDKSGINISKGIERRIENVFFREDFRRTGADDVGKIDFPSRIIESYIQGFFNSIDSNLIKNHGFKVVLDYGFGSASLVLPLILGDLGVEAVSLNSYLDAAKSSRIQFDQQDSLHQLANIVVTLQANFGILFDSDAENFNLVDEKGNIIKGQLLLALFSTLAMKHSSYKMIAVPNISTKAIDEISQKYDCKVVKIKSDKRSLMYAALAGSTLTGPKRIGFSGNVNGGMIFSEFQPSFDAMFSFAKLLEFLSKEKRKLSEVINEIPKINIGSRKVECTWNNKGRVMRKLMERFRYEKIELLEGIKIFYDSYWVSVFPDQLEPYFHIYIESKDQGIIEQKLNEYEDIINDLKEADSFLTARIKNKFLEKDPEADLTDEASKRPKVLQKILPEEKSFYFWSDSGYLGFNANNLQLFIEIMNYIQKESIEYHFKRKDFEKWLKDEFQLKELAEKISELHENTDENFIIRDHILNILNDYYSDLQNKNLKEQ